MCWLKQSLRVSPLAILFWPQKMKRIAFIFKNLKGRRFLMYFILTKKKLRIFVPGYKLKQSACPDTKLSDSFVTSVCTRTSSMIQKSQAILILVFIHLSFIYRETDGFMLQLPIVSISGHLFWSALSLVYWPLAQWAWPSLNLDLWHLLIPLPVCKY